MRYVDYGVLKSNSLENKRKKRKKIVLFTAALLATSIIGVFGYAFYWPLSNLFGQLLRNPGTVLSFFRNSSAELKSTDGKTNFLLLGIDKRSNVPYTYSGPAGKQEHNGFLADTIIVASFDLETKKTVLISIPRDTWVSIPSWNSFPASEGKINSAYSLGDVYGFPGGGLSLAKKVVSTNLGIPLHYAVRVDFEGFVKAVNTLGGIDIAVENTFDDYQYPTPGKETVTCSGGNYNCRFERIHFDKGTRHMDGDTALKYVRSRSGTNSEGSDFARARRQQKVIQAFLKKSVSAKTLLDPFKVNSLFKDLEETIETDFDFAAIPAVVKLAKDAQIENIETMVTDIESGLMIAGDPGAHGGAYTIVPKNGWAQVRLKVKEFIAKASPKKEK